MKRLLKLLLITTLVLPLATEAVAVLLYLAAISGFWLLGRVLAPDRFDVLFDGKSYVPGRLDSNTWKFGVYLLTDTVLLAVTTLWWFWREHAPNPSLQGTHTGGRP